MGVHRLVIPAAAAVFDQAKNLHLAHHVSFWDATILAAELGAGINLLHSADVPCGAIGVSPSPIRSSRLMLLHGAWLIRLRQLTVFTD